MKAHRILHLIDSLAPGGAEQMAVMLANQLAKDGYRSFLCASRASGTLLQAIRPDVYFFPLRRVSRWDIAALFRLVQFTRRNQIQIIHAHTTSLFLAVAVSWFNPRLHVVWHDHFGRQKIQPRDAMLYSFFARQARQTFAVTRELRQWAVLSLRLSPQQVTFLPNFVSALDVPTSTQVLPGLPAKRVVCVANIREQKDHVSLIRAWAQVISKEPQAHLLLVGAETNPVLAEQVRQIALDLNLKENLTWLGSRSDVADILASCQIGVLSSISEGFPVTLLEYGRAGLAVVATEVGESAEILAQGKAGVLVPPGQPQSLASALLHLLQREDERRNLGLAIQRRVRHFYSPQAVLKQVYSSYERILSTNH